MAAILPTTRGRLITGTLLSLIIALFLFAQFGTYESPIPIPFRATEHKDEQKTEPKSEQQLEQPEQHVAPTIPADKLLDDTLNATLGFQKIYCINLPTRTDHRDSLALAAAFSGLDITFIDGVTHVEEKVLPPGGGGTTRPTEKNNWRAHMNVMRDIIEKNVQSALILEDDADWDMRIKPQMRRFAQATRRLLQPLAGTNDTFMDATMPPLDGREQNVLVDNQIFNEPPLDSPYGDLSRWDILWVGHCGTQFPKEDYRKLVPLGRAVQLLDETVPAPKHFKERYGSLDILDEYPAHTRVVHRARENVCTPAYAVSMPGARRILYELGVHYFDRITDLSLAKYCDGDGEDNSDFMPHVCLSVQPELFQSHRSAGSMNRFSDIDNFNSKVIEHPYTINIRQSVQVNLPKLVAGDTDLIDQFKDDEDPVDLAWTGS